MKISIALEFTKACTKGLVVLVISRKIRRFASIERINSRIQRVSLFLLKVTNSQTLVVMK